MRCCIFLITIAVLFLVCQAKRKKKTPGTTGASTDSNSVQGSGIAKENIPTKLLTKAERHKRAKEMHKIGIDYAMKSQYEDALSYMRIAVRYNPDDSGFQNDLGVTEMRMGQLHKAKTRFLRAKELNPGFKTTEDNINELKQSMGEENFQLGIGDFPQKHHLEEPPHYDAKEFERLLVSDDAADKMILGKAPIMIRGAAQAWGWDFEKLTLDHISDNYGDSRADYYPHNMKEETVNAMWHSLKGSIDDMVYPKPTANKDTSLPGTYIQWNVNEQIWRSMLKDMNAKLPEAFEDKWWTEQCFDDEGVTKFNLDLHWKMMLIGEKDAGMFNHKDVMRMASWQVQITGRKKWHICSPTQDPYVYGAGDVNNFKPDYGLWPKMINASCYQTISNPGDAMYYPRDWWHQTLNLETPSIAFSGSMVNKHCHKEFATKLLLHCGGGGTVFHADDNHCKKLDKCIRIWDKTYENGTGVLPERVDETDALQVPHFKIRDGEMTPNLPSEPEMNALPEPVSENSEL